jgi:hypothetical protein
MPKSIVDPAKRNLLECITPETLKGWLAAMMELDGYG